jgi:stage II sporulation protein AA (anti-sigma F factor antagonist)
VAELEHDPATEAAIDARTDPSGAAIVTVSGDLDISNADALEAAVASIVARSPERLVFDLSRLRFMDSAGIAVLLGAAAKVQSVHIRNPTPAVRRVVELTGLTQVLPIEP